MWHSLFDCDIQISGILREDSDDQFGEIAFAVLPFYLFPRTDELLE